MTRAMQIRLRNVYGHGIAVGAVPWYLAGGVPLANCVAAYQPKGAANLAASYINLANPGTYDCTAPVAAPTFNASTGWSFASASSQYLVTGVIPALNQTWSLLIRFSAWNYLNNEMLAGCVSSPGFGFYSTGAPITAMNGTQANAVTAGARGAAGVVGFRGKATYLDGVAGTDIPTANGPAATEDIYIGAFNNAGSPGFYLNGNILAIAVYNTTITEAQLLAITTAMAAL